MKDSRLRGRRVPARPGKRIDYIQRMQDPALTIRGRDLMAQAFRPNSPLLLLASAGGSRTSENIQTGYQFLFMGAMAAIRNPHAHEPAEDLIANEALERLAFASFLMRRLDDARPATTPEN